ncbi:MAG: hypothetical protein EXQ56_14135 [Acidobacteria bacterium]|nr:hypothetical protein [Acidobacteriota bacterium]
MTAAHPTAASGLPAGTGETHRAGSNSLARQVNALAWVTLAAIGGITAVSPFLAARTFLLRVPDSQKNCGWCGRLEVEAFTPGLMASAYLLSLLLCTGTFLVLLMLLRRNQSVLTPGIVRSIYGWAFAFGLAALLAMPILVNDLWFSIAWGRLGASGVNPYHSDLTAQALRELPFGRSTISRSPYGPTWTAISSALAWLAHGKVWAEFLLFKLLLGMAWFGSLAQLRALLATEGLWLQAVGAAVLGWLPLSVLQAVSEGHNDIVMVFLMLSALRAVQRNGDCPERR